jgi:uncharacterized FlaG/YvyC family protein
VASSDGAPQSKVVGVAHEEEDESEEEVDEDEDISSPKSLYFEALNAMITARGATGKILIRGISDEDSEDSEEEEEQEKESEKKNTRHTTEQISTLRFVIITASGEKSINSAMNMVTDDQLGSGIMMFNTSSGNNVIAEIPNDINKAMRKKKVPLRFDALFGLTLALKTYDCWLYDNEMWGEGEELDRALRKLGKAWKKLLSCSNDELEIDGEYTRPGVECLLEQFEELCQQGDNKYAFPWK